jgi:hypothetical protein
MVTRRITIVPLSSFPNSILKVGLALRTIGCWVAEKPKLPHNFEDITWAKIKEAVTAIHQKQPVSCSLEELYRVINQFLFRLINLARVSGIQVYHIACYVCLINAPFCRQLKICACTKWLATYIAGFSKNVRSILRPSCNC